MAQQQQPAMHGGPDPQGATPGMQQVGALIVRCMNLDRLEPRILEIAVHPLVHLKADARSGCGGQAGRASGCR